MNVSENPTDAAQTAAERQNSTPLLSLRGLVKRFDISGGLLDQLAFSGGRLTRRRTVVRAVNNVSFDIARGETLSVVGESGCGKSTLARMVINIYPPDDGEIHYRGQRIDNLSHNAFLPYRTKMQMVFQDPYSSLNPRKRVSQILEEPVLFHWPKTGRAEAKDKVAAVMEQVGVSPSWGIRFPHEFSGGQRQRISLARALMVDPEFIVADEPISALDVSIQAQILNLMMDMQEQRGLTYLFISHDLSVVRHISSRVAVMYLGSLCELADAEGLFENPRHPYSKALLSAIPRIGGNTTRLRLQGDVPTPINLPPGCVFHGRCQYADERCRAERPEALPRPGGGLVACHRVQEGKL